MTGDTLLFFPSLGPTAKFKSFAFLLKFKHLFLFPILTHIFFSYKICSLHGDIAQLVEHTAHIRAVIGPSPIVPIKACFIFMKQAIFLLLNI